MMSVATADNLLSKSAVSQLVAETIKLKQLCVLHEVGSAMS